MITSLLLIDIRCNANNSYNCTITISFRSISLIIFSKTKTNERKRDNNNVQIKKEKGSSIIRIFEYVRVQHRLLEYRDNLNRLRLEQQYSLTSKRVLST